MAYDSTKLDNENIKLKYVTISIDESVRNDLTDVAHYYAKKIGMRKISMNDLMLIMLKNFHATQNLKD